MVLSGSILQLCSAGPSLSVFVTSCGLAERAKNIERGGKERKEEG